MRKRFTRASALARTSVALSALLLGSTAYAQSGEEAIDPNAPETGAPIDTEIGDTPEELQESATTGAEGPADPGQIVVTGTLVRGIAPPGASPVSVSDEDIQATGATNVNDVLESIPQLGSFGTLQQPLGNSQEVSTNKPSLRNLGSNTAGGSTTLVLIDGHRVVGMGTASTVPDPDVIPPGVLQRVEVVPDGGSAIYGSDAVAGVLNFITIRRFDGVKVDAQYGFADDFYRYSANVTAGRDWGSGSLYASYNYAKNDVLLGRDRDYIRTFPDATGLLSLACSPGNILDLQATTGTAPNQVTRPIVDRVSALGPNGTFTRGRANECDLSDFGTIFPAQRRHSVFAGLSQDLNDSITLDLRAFYTNRRTRIENGPYTFSERLVPVATPNTPVPLFTISPFTRGVFTGAPGIPFSTPYISAGFATQVSGRFGPDFAQQTTIELDTWGITPTVTADLDGNWQLRVLGSYGQSVSNFRGDAVNTVALSNAITSGLFNPYNPTTASAGLIDAVTDFQTFGRTKQYFHDLRAIVDGDLFTLPGGAVKLAAGIEYFKEEFDTQRGDTAPGFENSGRAASTFTGTAILPGSPMPQTRSFAIPALDPIARRSLDRQVKSAFGELVIPIFGADNRIGGFHSLNVSLSGRYDDYDDVGGTFNPRIGVTWKPVEWVSIFGAWGEAFNAPSLADNEFSDNSTLFVLSGPEASFFAPPAALVANGTVPAFAGGQILAVRGNAPGTEPQEAETYNIGFDVRPPFIEGLSFGATYYNIRIDNLIGLPPFESPADLYQNFRTFIDFTPSQAEINAAQASADIIRGATRTAFLDANRVYAFFDARRRNLGSLKVDGLDFRLAYERPFDFGSVFLNFNGTGELNREQSPLPGAPFASVLDDDGFRIKTRTTLGANVGPLLGQVTWNHLPGFDLRVPVGFAGTTLGGETFVAQTDVDAFDTFDLFFRYELSDLGMADDLALTLNVENVFDTDPPEFRGGNQVVGARGIRNGNTLGRLIQFGVSTKF